MKRPRRSRTVATLLIHTFLCAATTPVWAQRRPTPRPAPQEDRDEEDSTDPSEAAQERRERAERVGGVTRLTGYELELHGGLTAPTGGVLRLRGVAYEVRGLATLRVFPNAQIEAWSTVGTPRQRQRYTARADAQGRFTLEMPAATAFAVWVGRGAVGGDDGREFTFSATVTARTQFNLLLDRALYEPGESAHAWLRLLNRETQAPVGGASVLLEAHLGSAGGPSLGTFRGVTTSAGVFAQDVPLPATVATMPLVVIATVGDPAEAHTATANIGRRTVERLLAEVSVQPSVVAPGARTRVRVVVRTPSGAPVRNAEVRLRFGTAPLGEPVRTDAQGVVEAVLSAPAFTSQPIEPVSVIATVTHRAHGAISASSSLTVARNAYRVDAVAAHGALVPEVPAEVYFTVSDPTGAPPPAGTPVSAIGAGFLPAGTRATTDAHGIAVLSMRLPAGSAARHENGACGGARAVSFDVTVESAVPLSTRLCLPVAVDAQVRVRASRPVAVPGARVEFTLDRRPAVRARSVSVDLLDGTDRVLATTQLAANTARGALALPAGYVGVATVRARPVHGIAGASGEGTGSRDAVLVRPGSAFALSLAPTRPVFHVRDEATVALRSPAGLRGGHVALVVRDVAAQGGEVPWRLQWLGGAFDRAAVSANDPASERLLRTALAGTLEADPVAEVTPPAPPEGSSDDAESYEESDARERGDLRDPIALRDQLLRNDLGEALTSLESAVAEAATSSEATGVFTRGPRRGFDPAVVWYVSEHGSLSLETLGGRPATLAMIQAVAPEFTFDRVARRVARKRLVELMSTIASYSEAVARGNAADESPDRWLSRLIERNVFEASSLRDPWGGTYTLHRVAANRAGSLSLGVAARGWELVSPGPDRVAGTGDDVRDPFERVVPAGTLYARASGEDRLMRALAALDPGNGVLGRMLAAYDRVGRLAAEDGTEDATGAEESESAGAAIGYGSLGGLGVSGTGAGGGGSGQGYGMGAGRGLARRASVSAGDAAFDDLVGGPAAQPASPAAMRAPAGEMRAEGGEVLERSDRNSRAARRQGPQVAALASLVRERFPATLHVVAEAALDPSGTTTLPFRVADALTTWRVDAIAWTDDGWTSSATTDVRVDQDAVVDAPVPAVAVPGDVLRLPVRVSNRSERTLRVRLGAESESGLRLRVGEGAEIEVPAGDAREVPISVEALAPSEGFVRVFATDASGAQLDAARRPMRILAAARPARAAVEQLLEAGGRMTLQVPADAAYRADGSLRIQTLLGVFGDPAVALVSPSISDDDRGYAAWGLAFMQASAPRTPEERTRLDESFVRLVTTHMPNDPGIARLVGALWGDDDTNNEVLERAVTGMVDWHRAVLEVRAPRGADARAALAARDAELLYALAPALAHPNQRGELGVALRGLAGAMRAVVESDTPMLRDEAPLALAAAALGLAGYGEAPRAREFLRRATRAAQVPTAATLLLARTGIALASQGRRDEARALLQRIATRVRAASENTSAYPEYVVLAARATTLPTGDARLPLRVDGRAVEAALTNGVAHIGVRELSTPGAHRIEFVGARETVLFAQAEARYGRPWESAPPVRGPLALSIEGDVGARDGRSSLTLRVQNRGPSVQQAPLVELDMPAGAELDQDSRVAMARRLSAPPQIEGRTLVLRLRSLAPGGTARVPLPLRWSTGGALRGLGAAGYTSSAVGSGTTVLAPRVVEVAEAQTDPPAAPRAQESR